MTPRIAYMVDIMIWTRAEPGQGVAGLGSITGRTASRRLPDSGGLCVRATDDARATTQRRDLVRLPLVLMALSTLAGAAEHRVADLVVLAETRPTAWDFRWHGESVGHLSETGTRSLE
jgi:hypothetical protein